MTDQIDNGNFIELASDIVGAFVSKNNVAISDLPNLISQVHSALQQAANGTQQVEEEPPTPAVPVKKSVTPDYIVCLEDGKKFKSLKRHLRTKFDMSPEEYRAKWGLPRDYPMVAPNYANARSELARSMGLGQKRRAPVEMPAPTPVAAKRPRAARKKAEAA